MQDKIEIINHFNERFFSQCDDGTIISDMMKDKFPAFDPYNIPKEAVSEKQRDQDIMSAIFEHLR